MTYKHNEPTVIEGVMGNIKTYVLLILIVAAGLVAQISFLGPTTVPKSQVARNSQAQDTTIDAPTISVSVAPVSTLSFAPEEKASPIKNSQPPQQNSETPQLQASSTPSNNDNHKDKKKHKGNDRSAKKPSRKCLLFNRFLCF